MQVTHLCHWLSVAAAFGCPSQQGVPDKPCEAPAVCIVWKAVMSQRVGLRHNVFLNVFFFVFNNEMLRILSNVFVELYF